MPHHYGEHQPTEESMFDEPRRTSRRVVLRAATGMAALAASGIGLVPSANRPVATAQEVGGTRANTFIPAEDGITAADAAQGEWVIFEAAWPFWALGASWPESVGLWPIVAVQLSEDGTTWSETIDLAANTEDGGQPNRDNRLFTPLLFTDGARFARYQTIDRDRLTGELEGLSFVYIDPTDGPWEQDITPAAPVGAMSRLINDDTFAPPEIITRQQWGANENWRFDTIGEVWPPEYKTVSHIIIHHTATTNSPSDVPNAIRSIYYYHAVEQGWGDIGYNYLVDHNGRIYQGRYGGQDVIGGHSYQYAVGSSGISTIGNFMTTDISEAAKSALVSIVAWVGRDLDPLGRSAFWEVPDLPTIASHRDVNATSCPGDRLWNDLPELRTLVAQTLDEGVLDTGLPAGIVPGDRVRVQTDTGESLNLRSTANGTISGSLPNNALAWVIDGPELLETGNWYRLEAVNGGAIGWAIAQFLIVDPQPIPGGTTGDYLFGLNLRVTESVNVRRTASVTAGIVGVAQPNTWAYVLAGPVIAEGWEWYQIRTQSVGDGWVISTAIAPAPFNNNPVARFAVGDTVTTTQSATIRPRPGVAQRGTATAASGSQLVISQPPVEVTGYIWYGVFSDTYGGGWIEENYLRGVAPPAGKFEIGDGFRVTSTTNLRSAATTSGSVVTTMQVGTTGTVIGGPATANGYIWWQVRLANGTTGWCIENWLVESVVTPPPAGKFVLGDTFRVSEATNLRSAGSTSGGVVTTMQAGTTGTVIGGSTSANGYIWWQVRLANGTTGWCIENWLVKTDGSADPTPSTKFAIGDSCYANTVANLRSSASTSGSVVRTLAVNETGTVIGGPTWANSLWWWQVSIGDSSGWVEESALTKGAPSTDPGGSFEIGATVSVTARANLRTGAGTSNSVIRVAQVGDSGTVLAGPSSANGYIWWRVQFSGATGWIIEDVLSAGSTPPPPPSGGLPAGTVVRVTDMNVRFRSGAGTSSSVIAVLQSGHRLTIVSGPTTGSGYSWYQATSATAGTGYIAADFIARV